MTENTATSATATTTAATATTASPRYDQVLRGGEPAETATVASTKASPPTNTPNADQTVVESSDNGGAANVVSSKKPAAWNKKPANGGGSASVESAGPVVIGAAEQWPALSESTKASPKLTPSPTPLSSDSLKQIPDFGSTVSSQPTLSTQKPSTSNQNHNPAHNHGRPSRQKSMKRDGGGSIQANGGFTHQPLPHGDGTQSHNGSGKPNSGGGSESSGRDNAQNHGQRNAASGEHPQPRSSYKRGNGGPHSRGDGSHQNYGGRRGGDQDRGNHDWNHPRGYNGRDAPLQHRGGPRGGYTTAPPVTAPYGHPVGPAPMRPLYPMDVPVIYIPQVHGGVPYGTVPGPTLPYFIPPLDPQLHAKIVTQIDYYFSNENLIKDTYLRQNMDKEGWVPISLIAGFKKVSELTENHQLILDVVRLSSSVVEVQGDKIRRRDDWTRWIMPPSVQIPIATGSQSPRSPNIGVLSAQTQSITLTSDSAPLVRASSSDSNKNSTKSEGARSSG